MQEPTAPSRQQASGRRRVGADGQATSKPAGPAQGACLLGRLGKQAGQEQKQDGQALSSHHGRQTPPGRHHPAPGAGRSL